MGCILLFFSIPLFIPYFVDYRLFYLPISFFFLSFFFSIFRLFLLFVSLFPICDFLFHLLISNLFYFKLFHFYFPFSFYFPYLSPSIHFISFFKSPTPLQTPFFHSLANVRFFHQFLISPKKLLINMLRLLIY